MSFASQALYEMYTAGDLGDEYSGTEVMFLTVHPGQAIQMRDTEVRRPEDLEGLNMRAPSRTGAWMIEALGANPVTMPVSELSEALSRREVDGAFINWGPAPGLGFQDLTDYQIEGPDKKRFGTAAFQVSMNQEKWDSLPEDVKQAFRDASGPDWWAEVGRIWRETDDRALEVLTAAGNQHIVLTEEEWAAFEAALEPVVQRWIDEVTAQGIDGEALVEKARRLIEENSRPEKWASAARSAS